MHSSKAAYLPHFSHRHERSRAGYIYKVDQTFLMSNYDTLNGQEVNDLYSD